MEAKYHRESLLQDRKTLAEQLKALKESVQGTLDESSDENKSKVTPQFIWLGAQMSVFFFIFHNVTWCVCMLY